MPSFQIPVLGFADGFLSPFPDSLPQLFLRCLPCALAFGLSPSVPLPFVRFSSGSYYSASVSSFPLSSRLRLTVASSVLPLCFRFLGLPRSFRPDFSCLLSRFFVLGFLFVSFHPSRLRSHSCSTGASLLLSLSGLFPHFAFFRPLPLGSDYSAFRSFFSLLPVLPCRRFLRCLSSSSVLPVSMLSFRFWYLAFLHFLSPFAFSPHSGYLSASAFSFRFRPLPLGFRFRFWLLGLGFILSDTSYRLRFVFFP